MAGFCPSLVTGEEPSSDLNCVDTSIQKDCCVCGRPDASGRNKWKGDSAASFVNKRCQRERARFGRLVKLCAVAAGLRTLKNQEVRSVCLSFECFKRGGDGDADANTDRLKRRNDTRVRKPKRKSAVARLALQNNIDLRVKRIVRERGDSWQVYTKLCKRWLQSISVEIEILVLRVVRLRNEEVHAKLPVADIDNLLVKGLWAQIPAG